METMCKLEHMHNVNYKTLYKSNYLCIRHEMEQIRQPNKITPVWKYHRRGELREKNSYCSNRTHENGISEMKIFSTRNMSARYSIARMS